MHKAHLYRHCLLAVSLLFHDSILRAFFSGNKWVPVRSAWILLCSFLMLWASANRMSSVFTFTVPRHRNRRNPLSGFRSPNEPSAWMLRFIRSSQPTSLMIRFRSSFRYSTNYLDTYSALLRSISGFLLRFPLIHSFLCGHPSHSWQLYTWVSHSYPVLLRSFLV